MLAMSLASMMCRFYGDESATDWIRLVLSEDDSRIHTDLNAYAKSITRNETISCIRPSGHENTAAATQPNILPIDRRLSRLGIVNFVSRHVRLNSIVAIRHPRC